MVSCYLDSNTNTLSNKLSIYRKECHKGSYIHSSSCQPSSTKRAVIRSMFLRAYRYCDTLFLRSEEQRIYDDFGRLGYSKGFITKAKVSARQGRDHEIRIRAGLDQPKASREKARFHLAVPYHRTTCGLGYRFGQRGIDVAYTSKDSVKSRLAHKVHKPTNGGV